MNRKPLPTADEVRAYMDQVLEETAETGRHPRTSMIVRHFGIPQATFYRNYPDLIDGFQQQAAQRKEAQAGEPDRVQKREDDLARLRRLNSDLRKQNELYAESIRQLTIDNAALKAELEKLSNVSRLVPRSAR